MPKFTLLQITTFRKHVKIEAESIEEALDKARNDIDLCYAGINTPDFDTEFKPDLNWNTIK